MADDKVAIWGSGLKFGRKPINGELLIGNGQDLTLATLTAGSGVSISNAAGAVTISATGIVGALGVPSGGTGQTSLTLNNVILGNGTNPVQFVAPGAAGNVLTSNGTTWSSTAIPSQIPSQTGNAGKALITDGTNTSWGSSIVSGTAVTSPTSTEVDFSGIPSWVRRVTLLMTDISFNGATYPRIRLGTTTFQTTGYYGSSSIIGSGTATISYAGAGTGGFDVYINSPTSTRNVSGQVVFSLINPGTNLWVCSGTFGWTGIAFTTVLGGYTTLSAALQQIRVIPQDGTSSFDAGTLNIFWE